MMGGGRKFEVSNFLRFVYTIKREGNVFRP